MILLAITTTGLNTNFTTPGHLEPGTEIILTVKCRRTARLLARKTSLDLRSLVKINIDARQIRSNVTDTQRILYTQLTT